MSLVLLTVFCNCAPVLAQQAIPTTFFGIHVNDPTFNGQSSYPLGVTYGQFRNWDVYQVSWPDIERCEATTDDIKDTCFGSTGNDENFKPLTNELVNLHNANQYNNNPAVDNVMFTLSRTPKWADANSNQQTDPCVYYDPNDPNNTYGGACYAPTGPTGDQNYPHLHADGTGDDLIWRRWVTAVATWVNNSSLCQNSQGTCAHVKYWEIWNEFNRNSTDPTKFGQNATVSWYASLDPTYGCPTLGHQPCPTPDQLMRMTEDARCIIVGIGYVENYPNLGDHTACSALGWPKIGIDSSAEIVQPSITGPGKPDSQPSTALQCYLYCDHAACGTWYNGQCQSSWDYTARSVDVMNFHWYTDQSNPETLDTSAFRAALQTPELNKPLWVGEGSWGNSREKNQQGNYSNFWTDKYAQGGFIPRWFAAIWSQTLPVGCDWSSEVCQQAFWYGYDYDTNVPNTGYTAHETGAVYCAGQTAHGSCNDGSQNGVGLIQPQAAMWNTAFTWLNGATPSGSSFCTLLTGSSTVWHCDFTKNGSSYSMVWDNSYSAAAQGKTDYCATKFPANPYVCGATTYAPDPKFTRWVDLSGTVRAMSQAVPFKVGLNPVLLEP